MVTVIVAYDKCSGYYGDDAQWGLGVQGVGGGES